MNRFVNLLFLRGEKPTLNDWEASLEERLGHRRAAVLNYGPLGVKVGSLSYTASGPKIDRIETHAGLTDLGRIVELLHTRTDCNGVIVGFGNKVRTAMADPNEESLGSLETLSRYFENQEDPPTIRQFLPSGGRSILEGTAARNDVRDLEQALASAGLTVMRLQLTSLAILNSIIPFVARHSTSSSKHSLLVVADQGSFTCLLTRGDDWLAARGAPIYYLNPSHPKPEETEHITDFFASLIERADGQGIKIGYFDSGVPASFELINRSVFKNMSAVPEVLKWDDEEFPHLDLEAICQN